MENTKSTQSGRRARASEMAKIARVTTALRQLRHLGFHRVDLPADSEFVSDGPSLLHEVGYCSSGEVLLLVGHGFERVETFTVRQGDVFFLPAGSAYSIHNTAMGESKLVVAASRDGLEPSELPLEGGRAVVLDVVIGNLQMELGPPSRSSESDGYEVLFHAQPNSSYGERTVGEVFSKDILAREFGVSEAQLPDMSFGFCDPLVVRPIGQGVQSEDDLEAFNFS